MDGHIPHSQVRMSRVVVGTQADPIVARSVILKVTPGLHGVSPTIP
jgi:hypothetical protein